MEKKAKTIQDFGEQFERFPDYFENGFLGGTDGILDFFGPLLDPKELIGARVAEIGSGPGRIVNILAELGAAEITALEPSSSFAVLKANTAAHADIITFVNEDGEGLPLLAYDYVFAVGVLHHIPDVDPVVNRAYAALRPGGDFLVWLYGCEGNELYLSVVGPVRWVSTRIPDPLVTAISCAINMLLSLYIPLCRYLPLPMRRHMLGAFAHYSWKERLAIIFDQLNPAYAKYYSEEEARDLLGRAGFEDVKLFHRHGHSWAVRGRKPLT